MLDPPWPEHGGGKSKRGADKHYPLVPVDQMYAVISLAPVWLPPENAHMYMWATDTYLMAAGRLMADLGFRYVRTWAWVKLKDGEDPGLDDEALEGALTSGIGQYARGQHELLLFGVRGDGFALRTEARDIGSVIPACRGPRAADGSRHSSKPPLVHDLVEARSRGPYLEMFARSGRAGWQSWGNEIAA